MSLVSDALRKVYATIHSLSSSSTCSEFRAWAFAAPLPFLPPPLPPLLFPPLPGFFDVAGRFPLSISMASPSGSKPFSVGWCTKVSSSSLMGDWLQLFRRLLLHTGYQHHGVSYMGRVTYGPGSGAMPTASVLFRRLLPFSSADADEALFVLSTCQSEVVYCAGSSV